MPLPAGDPGIDPGMRLFQHLVGKTRIVDCPGEYHRPYHRRPTSDRRTAPVSWFQMRKQTAEAVDPRAEIFRHGGACRRGLVADGCGQRRDRAAFGGVVAVAA
jgi:hypothetical protein